MSANDLIRDLTNLGFVAIFLAVAIRTLRRPGSRSMSILLFFGVVAVIGSLSAASTHLNLTLPLRIVRIQVALLLVLPWILLNVAAEFGTLSRNGRRLSTLAMLLLTASVLVVPRGIGSWYLLLLVGYFTLVAAFATQAFVRLARTSKGVTRRRMQAVASGSAFLALALLLGTANRFAPAWAEAWTALSRVNGLLCVLSYFVGFVPPPSLRRLWQDRALRQFLQATAAIPPTADLPHIVGRLGDTVAEILGTPHVTVALWNEAEQALETPGSPPRGLPGSTPVERVFATQQSMFIPDAPKSDPANRGLYLGYDMRALMIAPITDGDHRLGVLAAFANRAPIFAGEDLALLELLATDLAGFLQRRALDEQVALTRARDEATRLKEEFLAAAAHDLRTPLTVILGQAQYMLRQQRRSPQLPIDRESLEELLHEAERMRDLTQDLLDVARPGTGGFVGQLAPIDVTVIAHEVAAEASGRSARHQVRAQGLACHVLGDERRLRQVLSNLVENAIKFSPAGGAIGIDIERDGDTVHLAVADEGLGIATDDLERIFERFERGSSPAAEAIPGTGMGLFLCRRIIEEHGGRIWAERLPRGSRFHVTLDAAPVDADESPEAERSSIAS